MGRRSHHHRGRHAPRPGRAPLPPSAAAPTLPPQQPDAAPAARPAEAPARTLGPTAPPPAAEPAPVAPAPTAAIPAPPAEENGAEAAASNGFTAAQLRRFIKSRSYIPMHELRRRFGINGAEDDVTAVDVGGSRVFVGLPTREGRLLGELLRQGDVGYELSVDPVTPIVVGVYPMRPVPRH